MRARIASLFGMRHHSMWIGLCGFIIVATAVIGCTLAYPLGDYPGDPVTDASTNAIGDALPAETGACGRIVPARSSAVVNADAGVGAGNEDAGELLFAMNAIELGTVGMALPFTPFNLDALCTCPEKSACTPPIGERTYCDQANGVDNAGGILLEEILRLTGGQKSLTDQLASGVSVLGIRLRNYNGQANDPEVEAMILPMVGTNTQPKWDGSDERMPNEYWLASTTPLVSKLYDGRAYVRDGYLVMSLSGEVPLGDFVLNTIEARLVGRVEGGRIVEGHLLTRIAAEKFIEAMSRFPSPTNPDAGICDGPIYDTVRSKICKSRDLPIDPNRDGTQIPCQALSFSVRFTTQTVRLGATVNKPPSALFCTAAPSCP
jgi:hypothetical protein